MPQCTTSDGPHFALQSPQLHSPSVMLAAQRPLVAQHARAAPRLALHRPARTFLLGPAYGLAKKMMPPISATEKAALESGGVSFERHIFAGTASVAALRPYRNQLSAAEQAFLDHEVPELCAMLDDHQIMTDKDFPPEVPPPPPPPPELTGRRHREGEDLPQTVQETFDSRLV